jgi:amino acid adenylation domain-containing protein
MMLKWESYKMNIEQFLAELHGLGVSLWLDGERLRYKAPEGVLSEDLRAAMARRKSEILEFMRRVAVDAGTTQPIHPAPRDSRLPLSFAQQRLWFLDQQGSHAAYNMPMVLQLRGRLDVQALERSLNALVSRHESLRTTIAEADGEPWQRIHPYREIALTVTDLRTLDLSDQEREWQRLAEAEAMRRFDLERDLMVRASLHRLADQGEEECHVLLLTLHHIASDGWSMGVFVREWIERYGAFTAGQPAPLPPLALQYADFAVWQRKQLQGEALAVQLSYWKARLAGAPVVLAMPTDRPRPAQSTFQGGERRFLLPADLVAELTALGRSVGATLFMTLLAAFQVLLGRYSGQEDVLVGAPIANRTQPELEAIIGFFVNTLVLRADLSGNPSFLDLLAEVRKTTEDAYANQDVPFERLVEELRPERRFNSNPLVQVALALQNTPAEHLELPGLQVSPLQPNILSVRLDMELHLFETANGLEGHWLYATDLFDAATIERMTTNFQVLLRDIVAHPTKPINALAILSASERRQVLIEWNDTSTPYPHDQCVHQRFEQQAARLPETVALLFDEGWPTTLPQTLSYRGLNEQANQLAHRLRQLGVGPDVLVGVCVERSPLMIIAVLGVLKAGGAYLPLDPHYPAERLAFMLADAAPALVLTHSALLTHLPLQASRILCLDTEAEALARQPSHNPSCATTPDNLAYVIYTSGSTGQPKGVLVPHRGLSNVAEAQARLFGLGPGERALQFSSLNFDAATFELWTALGTGATLCSGTRDTLAPGEPLHSFLERHQVSLATLTPSTLAALPTAPLQALHTLNVAGEACPAALVATWGASRRFFNLYGPTEATIWASQGLCANDGQPPCIGVPIANTRIYILDRNNNPAPIGVGGELCIGGVGVACGYWNRPELTAERFVPDPFAAEPDARMYRTGDMARWRPDGSIDYLGRIDQQVKIRGFRIELGEIEAALASDPALAEAAVRVVEDQASGPRLVAYFVPGQSDDATQAEHVEQWQTFYEESYGQASGGMEDPTFRIAGWNSSYTGEAIPASDMAEWVEATVAELLALNPADVLEIGCGSGLLLARVAPACNSYLGTDVATEAVVHIQQLRDSLPELANVSTMQRAADDFSGLRDQSFDLVILNSVVQYFPSIDYFLRVIEGAVRVLKPGGVLVLGDLRSLPLLAAYHASVQLYQAANELSRADLAALVGQRMADEEELLLDPALFQALPHHLPRIRRVGLRLKRGKSHNELTRFRYQALLEVGEPGGLVAETPVWPSHDWQREGWSIGALQDHLRVQGPDRLLLRNIPNGRLQAEAQTLDWLASSRQDTAGHWRAELGEEVAGIDPEALWELADELPYSVELTPAFSGKATAMDLYLERRTPSIGSALPPALPIAERPEPWRDCANNPLLGKLQRRLVPQLRTRLATQLPDHMIPSAWIALNALPLTPNGKLDRQALPAPSALRAPSTHFAAPGTPTEVTTALIWQEVLGVSPIGLGDNFFALGGHSLLATQVVARVRKQLGVELPLQVLFESATLAALAERIDNHALLQAPQNAPDTCSEGRVELVL